MSAVTGFGFHRLPILAVAALLAAACGNSAPSPSSPSSSATVVATPSPAPTRSPASPSFGPFPTLAPRPTYPIGCEGLDAVDLPKVAAEASATIGRFGWVLQVTRVEELYGSHAVAVPPPRTLHNEDVGQMLGGREFLTYASSSAGVPYEPPIHVESFPAFAASPYHEAKYTPHSNVGIDAFIQYGFQPKDRAVVVSPGGLIRIENGKPRLRLAERMELLAWTRGSLADAVKEYPPGHAVEVLDRRLEQQPDGSFVFRAPEAPGRYVAALSVKYESNCTTGKLWVVVNIDVE